MNYVQVNKVTTIPRSATAEVVEKKSNCFRVLADLAVYPVFV